MCAGSATAGPCKGDSGGPLTVVDKEDAHVLVGIVSKKIGQSCTNQKNSVFTKATSYMPWIEETIKKNGGMASCDFVFSAPPANRRVP